jgi:hypothetical protein
MADRPMADRPMPERQMPVHVEAAYKDAVDNIIFLKRQQWVALIRRICFDRDLFVVGPLTAWMQCGLVAPLRRGALFGHGQQKPRLGGRGFSREPSS